VDQSIAAVLGVLVILEVKHFVCDYPLQTAYQVNNKGKYGHAAGFLHAGLHALGTTTAFLVLPPSLLVGVAILAGEFVLHYHIDWAKDNLMRWSRVTVKDSMYWWMIGADQLLHHLTYVAIAGILSVAAA
jgi:hypothetical protein